MLTDPTKLRNLSRELGPTSGWFVDLRLIADKLEALEDSWADVVTLVNDRPKKAHRGDGPSVRINNQARGCYKQS